LAVLACFALSRGALANPAWHPLDYDELARVREATPRAAELFEQAEASLRAGELQAAERALREARVVAPNSYLLGRRHCQVLTELGRQTEAVEACRVALTISTAMGSRAFVGALMAGTSPPKPRELVQAVREAAGARRLQQQPFSEAAFCDIAYHIGDDAMLDLCVTALQAVAPNNFETLRWTAARRQTPAWPYWLGWGALGALVLFTGLHALWQWLHRPAKSRGAAAAAAALFFVATMVGGTAQAEEEASKETPPGEPAEHWQLSTFRINFADPESQIPSAEERDKNPLQFGYFLQDLNTEAMKAERKGDWRAAVKLWRAAAKAVPDMAIGFGRACRAYQVLGEVDDALQFCARAVNREGSTVEDYLRYAELVTSRPAVLSSVEVEDLDAIVKHLREKGEQAGPAAVVECRLGVKLEDGVRLARCTEVLGKLSPQEPRTMTFQWSYAMLRQDYGEANRLVASMEKSSMNRQALAQAQEATSKASAWWRRPLTDWRYAVGLGLGLAFAVIGLLLLRRRMSRLETSTDPGAAAAT
jgi:tetratricopeptide (TPR) repeat protein